MEGSDPTTGNNKRKRTKRGKRENSNKKGGGRKEEEIEGSPKKTHTTTTVAATATSTSDEEEDTSKGYLVMLLDRFRRSVAESSALSPVGQEGRFTDFIIECIKEKKTFYLHKCALAGRSKLFSRMFDCQFKEGRESKMDIREDDPTTADELEFFLHYMYSPESFVKKLCKYCGPSYMHAGYGIPLVPYRDFLVILDKFLDLGRLFLVDRTKELVRDKIFDPENQKMMSMFREEPALLNAIIFKHELDCTSECRYFVSASILAKMFPAKLADRVFMGQTGQTEIILEEDEEIERVLDHVLCDEVATRKTLRDFGLIHGLISERIRKSLCEVTDIECDFLGICDRLPPIANERAEVQECTTAEELANKIERVKRKLSETLTLASPTVDSLRLGWAKHFPCLDKTLSTLNGIKEIHRNSNNNSDEEEDTVNTQILPSE